MKLFVNSEQSEFTLQINNNNAQENTLQVNNHIYRYDLVDLGFGRYSLLLDNHSYTLLQVKKEDLYHVQIDNNHFVLQVEDEHSRKIKELFKNVQKEPDVQIIKAPIPGLVIKIDVIEGTLVEKGMALLILEAMKMENLIKASCSCRIKEIMVKEKDTVQLNQPLLKLVKE